MALPDDPTKVSLPQLKTPGMGNPPAPTPQPAADPMAPIKAAQQAAASGVTNPPRPYVEAAAYVNPIEKAHNNLITSPSIAPTNLPKPFVESAAYVNPIPGVVNQALGDTSRNQRPATVDAADAAAYAAQGAAKPSAPPAASPQAPAATAPMVPTAAPVAPVAAPTPANRTPVSDPYSGPAAGMINPSATPTSGVEDGMRQLQNLRALSDMTPQGGFNTLTDHAAEINAANEKRSNLAAAVEGMNKAGTRSARAGFAQIANTMMAGENQALTTGMNNQVQLAGQNVQQQIAGANNQVQMRGQTLSNNLGMRQVGATERGQDRTAQTAGAQIAEQARGHDLQSAVGNRQVDATLQGQQTQAQTAEKNIQANVGIHAADAASREKTAQQQLGASVQTGELRALPPGVFSMGGRYYQIDKKTKQPVPFGMPAP